MTQTNTEIQPKRIEVVRNGMKFYRYEQTPNNGCPYRQKNEKHKCGVCKAQRIHVRLDKTKTGSMLCSNSPFKDCGIYKTAIRDPEYLKFLTTNICSDVCENEECMFESPSQCPVVIQIEKKNKNEVKTNLKSEIPEFCPVCKIQMLIDPALELGQCDYVPQFRCQKCNHIKIIPFETYEKMKKNQPQETSK